MFVVNIYYHEGHNKLFFNLSYKPLSSYTFVNLLENRNAFITTYKFKRYLYFQETGLRCRNIWNNNTF